ncbi:hypothetical protein LptCag_1752 [Leptospirillum ferriphilum]|uniref:Uncharacterized protein n=2 Tax=Leptospirillum ferriphilum TaxID=178606 RepID=A0A094W5B2_9BACT|nr:hypothetical protein LFML04_1761 [Leptospirillum ferriphilum ML-04]KGA92608.1 hypothetical protein LptCag_1752 [Leptospirillum ferriphilum]
MHPACPSFSTMSVRSVVRSSFRCTGFLIGTQCACSLPHLTGILPRRLQDSPSE